ncbi:SMAD/FHA domain-containing protein [Thamnidium elegans]|nr:SMAD/FHA domain-containing protein [Thamnidium elegans]
MPNDQDFSSELDDYLAKSNQEQPAWIRDEETGVYVDHSKQVVMYTQEDGAWACGDYNQFYPNRILFTMIQHIRSMRLVVQSSPFFKQGQVVLIDENGITIGRDRSWDSRLRLPEMIVSKYHAMIYRDKQEKLFYMIDNGSQHGTFINEKRLSEPKQASLPYELRNMDIVRIGSTSLQVHLHAMGWPCQGCLASELIETSLGKKEKQQQQQVTVDLEESRREWIKNQKKMYQSDLEESNIYIDRAKIRRTHTKPEKFIAEEHYDDTPRPVAAAAAAVSYHTPVSGIGSKMLQKLGWQEGQSLGKHGDGILEPIRPSTQSSRSGLGVTTQPDMNMNESKKEKQWRLAQERYKNNFT